MAVTYNDTLKAARLQAVIDAIGAGGKLKIGTAGMALTLSVITLANPAFGSPAGGVMTLAGTPLTDTSADASGVAAAAIVTTSADVTIISGLTVTATSGGGDIELNSTTITAAQEVTITSGAITHG